jgi:hypothetical protein
LSDRTKLSTSSIQRLDQIWLASTEAEVVTEVVVWGGEVEVELPQAATAPAITANKTLLTRRTGPPYGFPASDVVAGK